MKLPQDPVFQKGTFSGEQAKKTIFIGLKRKAPYIFASIIFLTPVLEVRAGFFSWLEYLTEDASANTSTVVNSQTMPLLQAVRNPSPSAKGGGEITMIDGRALLAEVGPIGSTADIDDRTNDQISIYVVHKGDTLGGIAKMYDVSVNTIVWGNDLTGSIKEGQQLIILPISGVRHIVKAGDTIESIAKKYKGDVKEILQFNDLTVTEKLAVGDIVIVPDGELATPKPVVRKPNLYNPAHDTSGPDYGLFFTKPLAIYNKTQGLHGFNAVDLAAPYGSPIYSAAEGTVIIARNSGWNGGYGFYVVIAHANGTQTLYSHASRVIAYEGQYVSRGQVIAYLGSSGKVTGPHLHFEVRGAKNPF